MMQLWTGEDRPIAPAMPFFDYAIPRVGLEPPVPGSTSFGGATAQALKIGLARCSRPTVMNCWNVLDGAHRGFATKID